MKVGILHPGKMGVSIGANTLESGHETYWVSEGRSGDSRERAEKANLIELKSVKEMTETCDVILSVCPPEFASDVASEVLKYSYKGIYADLNAISPQRTKTIATMMEENGVSFVDGGVIGGPAWEPGTILYLSGSKARLVKELFTHGALEASVIGDEIGEASALKMVFSANTKGTTALLSATLATAEALGVRDQLEKHWDRFSPEFTGRTHRRIQVGSQKAWRFSGEMKEIADTFKSANVPEGIYLTASEIYEKIAEFKNREDVSLEEILKALSR